MSLTITSVEAEELRNRISALEESLAKQNTLKDSLTDVVRYLRTRISDLEAENEALQAENEAFREQAFGDTANISSISLPENQKKREREDNDPEIGPSLDPPRQFLNMLSSGLNGREGSNKKPTVSSDAKKTPKREPLLKPFQIFDQALTDPLRKHFGEKFKTIFSSVRAHGLVEYRTGIAGQKDTIRITEEGERLLRDGSRPLPPRIADVRLQENKNPEAITEDLLWEFIVFIESIGKGELDRALVSNRMLQMKNLKPYERNLFTQAAERGLLVLTPHVDKVPDKVSLTEDGKRMLQRSKDDHST